MNSFASNKRKGILILAAAYVVATVVLAKPAGFYCCGSFLWPWESGVYSAVLFGPSTLLGFLMYFSDPEGRWWLVPLSILFITPIIIVGVAMWIASRI